jgi:hypothetical protein
VTTHLVIVDEVGVEHRHIEGRPVADRAQLLRQPGLVARVKDPVALDHEAAAHNVLQLNTLI